jgi:hypothetical protein
MVGKLLPAMIPRVARSALEVRVGGGSASWRIKCELEEEKKKKKKKREEMEEKDTYPTLQSFPRRE